MLITRWDEIALVPIKSPASEVVAYTGNQMKVRLCLSSQLKKWIPGVRFCGESGQRRVKGDLSPLIWYE